jgi:hypothetical protein
LLPIKTELVAAPSVNLCVVEAKVKVEVAPKAPVSLYWIFVDVPAGVPPPVEVEYLFPFASSRTFERIFTWPEKLAVPDELTVPAKLTVLETLNVPERFKLVAQVIVPVAEMPLAKPEAHGPEPVNAPIPPLPSRRSSAFVAFV